METFENNYNRLKYSKPGIFSVSCVVSHTTIFGESNNVYESLVDILWKLRTGTFENQKLQQDFQNYSEECFDFHPITYDEESWADAKARRVELQRILKIYFHGNKGKE